MKCTAIVATVVLCFLFCPLCCAEETVASLLAGYLKNDLSLKTLSADVQKQLLSQQMVQISNGFSFQISSGTISIRTGENASAAFTPSASLSLPQAGNLTFSVSSDVSVDGDDSNKSWTNTSLSASVDLYSGAMKKRKVALMKAERTVLEAKRSLQNGYLSAEKNFYSSLKSLYSVAAEIASEKKTLYDDTITFEEIKAAGYQTTAPKYRTANMKVVSDWHTIEIKQRNLERETKIFASKCGAVYDGNDALAFLPSQVPEVPAVDVLSFSREQYSGVESALWTQRINTLSREADVPVTISANTGYTFNNTRTDSDTIDGGLSVKVHDSGLAVHSGLSVPVTGDEHEPSFTMGFSLSPNQFRTAAVSNKQNAVEEELEKLSVISAQEKYDTAIISQQTALEDLEWAKKSNKEMYDLYADQERELSAYYKNGYITLSEYMSAKVNMENYRIKLLVNSIDFILYNAETSMLFCRDGELHDER